MVQCEIVGCHGVHFNSLSIAPATYIALCQKHYDEEMYAKYGAPYKPTKESIPTTNTFLCNRCSQEKPWLIWTWSARWGQYFQPDETRVCLACVKQDEDYIRNYGQLS